MSRPEPRPSAPRAAAWVLAALTAAVLGGPFSGSVAHAQPDPADEGGLDDVLPNDYALANTRWNGLSTLAALGRGLGFDVVAAQSLDWEDLGASDVLFVLYPTERIRPDHLAGFVRNGGRVLLADDFGDSSEAIGRLGMLRARGVGVDAANFHEDLPFAPLARPWLPNHPLAAGVDELATNHPAILTKVRGAEVVFGFGEGEALVAAGAIGDGRFVVLSDPSVFINRMLQFRGNLRFATNAMRFLARPGQTNRVVILTGRYELWGEPAGLLDDGTVRGTVAQMANDFNRWLDEQNDYLLTPEGLRAIGAAAALLIALLGLALLPLARRQRLDGDWTRARGSAAADDDYEHVLIAYDRGGFRGNHLLPAAVIRDGVNARLARVLGRPQPLYTLTEAELLAEVTQHCGGPAAAALRHVHRRLKALPSRLQAASAWSAGFLSRREFERLHDDVSALYRTLDSQPFSPPAAQAPARLPTHLGDPDPRR